MKRATVVLIAAVAAVAVMIFWARRTPQPAPATVANPPPPLSPATSAAVAFQNLVTAGSNWTAQYLIDRIFPSKPANAVESAPIPLNQKAPSTTNGITSTQLVTTPYYA
jgi:hypothetical protein